MVRLECSCSRCRDQKAETRVPDEDCASARRAASRATGHATCCAIRRPNCRDSTHWQLVSIIPSVAIIRRSTWVPLDVIWQDKEWPGPHTGGDRRGGENIGGGAGRDLTHLSRLSREDEARLDALFASHKCTHAYLDVGSNIGVQAAQALRAKEASRSVSAAHL